MTGQLSLFDLPPGPLVRASDPETSRVAAKTVNVSERRQEVIDAMRLISVAATASEIHQVIRDAGSRVDIGSVRSRLNELNGLRVRKAGVKTVRPPRGSGRPETLWALT